ncbi:hypothetical protein BTJ40_12165 [Microbulbifer sp. A4B17]|uniref:hypothetical protein n=1 Tax=Microbulbifer sp. A4B17 TaxID=359370 RepID=UPI000D52CA2A|nr:hypothetical protein [Microbulbifer sp. A4B17]AWF81517.1 hypothetical protein BTJ40_12165 [Microbulbifer sp. A4B17]
MYQPYAYAQGIPGQPQNYTVPPINPVIGLTPHQPYLPLQQLAPQGLLGEFVSRAAPVIGGIVGGPQGQLINALGGLGQLLPFQAVPQVPQQFAPHVPQQFVPQIPPQYAHQFAPQGYLSELINRAAPVLANYINNPQAQLINAATQLGQYLPYQAAPQLAPQGLLGEFVSRAAPVIGNYIGGPQGQFLNNVARLGHLLPFQAAPHLVPQGYIGQPVNQLAPFIPEQYGTVPPQAFTPLNQPVPFQAVPQPPQQPFQSLAGIGQPLAYQAMPQPNSALQQQAYLH